MSNPPKVSRRRVVAFGAGVTTALAVSALAVSGTRDPMASGTPGTSAPPMARSPGTTVRASSFGHNLTDCTRFLQAALDSAADTVIIDYVPGGWLTKPLFVNRSNVTIFVEPNVMIRAVVGGFPELTDCLLTINDQSNVTVSGYGAKFVMDDYDTGEWRHALSLRGVRDVTVEGLTLRHSGGDGIYIDRGDGYAYNTVPHSSNVTLRDLSSINNRRQGISAISVDGLAVQGCEFRDTQGTAPESGLDCEPDHRDERLSGIVFRDCVFAGNAGAGVSISLGQLDADSAPVSITLDTCTIAGQAGHQGDTAAGFALRAVANGLSGSVELRDCLIDSAPNSNAIGILDKAAAPLPLTLTRVTVWDWGNAFQKYAPIAVVPRTATQAYGGVTFTDAVLVTDQPGPCFAVFSEASEAPLRDIHGTVTVVNPNGVKTDFGRHPENVDLAVRADTEGTLAQVNVRMQQQSVTGGQSAQMTFTRTGADLSISLAIAYATLGTARERYDYGGLGKVAVIPPGQREASIRVQTYPRRLTTDPRERTLVVTIQPGLRYVAGAASQASITIRG